jgi:tRNA pseudouridine38-40 synthase
MDVNAMQIAAALLEGEHDFWAFSHSLPPETNTVRRIMRTEVRKVRDEIWFDCWGTAFCRGMMRRMSGALWDIGKGRRDPEMIVTLLEQGRQTRIAWPVVLPAAGLTLMDIAYGRNPHEQVRTTPGDDQYEDNEE